ncbi:hypothetical protein [Collimonas pratensis]|uniref:hypothetical protein n=1 Tax=Collimonas pratensis TaxID=279113 RepID=UPI000785AC3C|nr:hypothetical protein [Collimonas pratensis]
MPQPTAADIAKLCDDWCAATMTVDGGMAIGASTEKFRLLANGVLFHELDHESLCAALIGLSKVLLRPGLNTIIVQDHFGLWSWCGELLLGSRAQLFPHDQYEIKSLYETCLHAALANCRKPVVLEEEWREQHRIQEQQPHHAKQLLQKSQIVLAYLAFPLLEAVLKRACGSFVSFDGQIVSAFTVLNKQGNPRLYEPQGAWRDRQCSSLRDLLVLHHTQVAEPDLVVLLDQFKNHIAVLDGAQDAYDLIFAWRNASLHGSTNFQTIGGTVLNLSLLISLFEFGKSFDQRRLQALAHCQREAQTGHKSPWSFYPPY